MPPLGRAVFILDCFRSTLLLISVIQNCLSTPSLQWWTFFTSFILIISLEAFKIVITKRNLLRHRRFTCVTLTRLAISMTLYSLLITRAVRLGVNVWCMCRGREVYPFRLFKQFRLHSCTYLAIHVVVQCGYFVRLGNVSMSRCMYSNTARIT